MHGGVSHDRADPPWAARAAAQPSCRDFRGNAGWQRDGRRKRHHAIRHRTGFTITKHGPITTWTTRNGRTYPVPPDKDITLMAEE